MSRRKKNLRAFKHQHSDDVITIEEAWDAAWEGAQKHYHSKRMQELEGTIGLERIATHKLKTESAKLREALNEAMGWNWLDDDMNDEVANRLYALLQEKGE